MKFRKILIGISLALLVYVGVRLFYFKPTLNVGEHSPVFSAKLANGSLFELDQLRGKYVLLDFWGSWCGPCIEDMPALNELYQVYNKAVFTDGAGFEIVSIAVEKEENRWRMAMLRFPMLWPYQILDQTSNLRFFNGPLSRQFGVKRLPSVFLLDPEGKIIGTNLSPDEIEKVLNTKLQ